jgi:signal transduction histidine kinase
MCEAPGIAFHVAGDTGEVSMTAQAIAYRVAREAVTNACKHSGATSIEAMVAAHDHGLRVLVHDNGVGFDPSALAGQPGHIGLVNAEQIVAGSYGEWHITSAAGAGTTVEFWLPDPEAR